MQAVFVSVNMNRFIFHESDGTSLVWQVSDRPPEFFNIGSTYITCNKTNIFDCDIDDGDGFTFNQCTQMTKSPTATPTLTPTTTETYPDELEIEGWDVNGHYSFEGQYATNWYYNYSNDVCWNETSKVYYNQDKQLYLRLVGAPRSDAVRLCGCKGVTLCI